MVLHPVFDEQRIRRRLSVIAGKQYCDLSVRFKSPILASMLYMVIERFKGGDPRPIGERFARQGRLLPDGVVYHASWVDEPQARCFQLMEAADVHLLDAWIERWSDIVDLEVVPVVTSQEYWAKLAATRSQP
jgi:hypothetical protein